MIGNTATVGALTDSLAGGFIGSGPVTGSGALSVAPGATGTLTVGLNTSTGGVISAIGTIALASHDAVQSDAALASELVTVRGTVVANAVPVFNEASGPGLLSDHPPNLPH